MELETELIQSLGQLPTPLNAQKIQAIEMLARGVGPKAVAEEVGVDRTTLYDWRQAPEFVQALAHHMRQLEKLILDPTPRLQGIVVAKEAYPELMRELVKIGLNSKSDMAKIAAIRLIKDDIDEEELQAGPTEDEKIIHEWALQNGLAIEGGTVAKSD